MSLESFLPQDSTRIPYDIVVQDVLRGTSDNGNVLEIVDYDFIKNGIIISKTLDLGQDGTIIVEPSTVNGRSHRLVVSKIPPEAEGMLFIAGFPYWDTTKQDVAIIEIFNEQNSEEDEIFWRRQRGSQLSSSPTVPYPIYGQSNKDLQRRLDDYDRENTRYFEKERERLNREFEEDEEIRDKYDRRRLRVNIDPELKHVVAFFPSTKSESGEATATLDFKTDVNSASFFIPYKPLPFDAFTDKSLLRLFLAYISSDPQLLPTWAAYFESVKDKVPIQARLAIASKIHTLGK